MKSTFSLLIASFACLIIVSGCSSSSTSPTTVMLTAPKVGSTFTYMNVTRDTNGVVTSTDTSVQRVLQSNYSIAGMTDAILVEETQGDGTKDTNYVRFTTSGDVELYSPFLTASFLPHWLPIPFTTHKTQTFKGDTVIVKGTFTEFDSTTFSLKYERNENVSVKGSAIASTVVSLNIISTYLNTNGTISQSGSSTNVSEVSFGISIGWLTHQKDITTVSNGRHSPLGEKTLIDYTLAK